MMKTMNDTMTTKVRRVKIQPTWIANNACSSLRAYIKLIKIREKQQTGIKIPKFSADAFLRCLFLTTECG